MREATDANPYSFEEAVQYLQSGHHIAYEVRVLTPGKSRRGYSEGALLTREGWLEDVAQHFFMDCDGMGDQFDDQGKLLNKGGDWIYPSTAKEQLHPDCVYILWYNR